MIESLMTTFRVSDANSNSTTLTPRALGHEEQENKKESRKRKQKIEIFGETVKKSAKDVKKLKKQRIVNQSRFPNIKVRTTPKPLYDAMQRLSKEQKECVISMGFEKLLDMKMDGIPSKIGFYVVDNLDAEKMEIKVGQTSLKISNESINEMLGLPIGKRGLIECKHLPDTDKTFQHWKSQFGKKSVRPSDLKDKIIDSNEADLNFKLNFIALVCNTLGDCSSSGTCNLNVLNYIQEDTDISNINWCGYIYDCVRDSRSRWSKESITGFYAGPITYLVLLYVDNFRCDFVNVGRERPLINRWNFERLKKRQDFETNHGGFGVTELLEPYQEIEENKEDLNVKSLLPSEQDMSSRTVYVGGIYRGKYAPPVEGQDIMDHLNPYGQLESVRIVPKRSCANVTFATRRAAEKAVKELDDNLQIKGRQLKVMFGTPPTPVVHYVSVQLPPLELGRPSSPIPIQQCAVDPPRTGAVIPSHNESAVSGSAVGPENVVGPDGNSAEELPREESSLRLPVGHCGVGIGASEGVSGNPSIGGEQVEPRTVPLGAKRFLEEAISPQETRERVMKRKKGPSTSTPPASPQPATPLGVGSAAGGESSEETPLQGFVMSSPRDALLLPMHLLETKSDAEIVNEVTEMTLKGVQAGRQLLAQLRQQEVRAAAAEERAAAAEARAAAAEARAVAAEAQAAAAMEARKGPEALLMAMNAQLQEMTQKIQDVSRCCN